MRQFHLILLLVLSCCFPSTGAAQQQSGDASFDAFQTAWREAWGRRNIDALSLLVAEDIDWVTSDGTWLKGREQFRSHHARLFKTLFKEAEWKVLDSRIRQLGPDTWMTITATTISGETPGSGGVRGPRSSVGTRVISRRDDRWLLQISHNTIITQRP